MGIPMNLMRNMESKHCNIDTVELIRNQLWVAVENIDALIENAQTIDGAEKVIGWAMAVFAQIYMIHEQLEPVEAAIADFAGAKASLDECVGFIKEVVEDKGEGLADVRQAFGALDLAAGTKDAHRTLGDVMQRIDHFANFFTRSAAPSSGLGRSVERVEALSRKFGQLTLLHADSRA